MPQINEMSWVTSSLMFSLLLISLMTISNFNSLENSFMKKNVKTMKMSKKIM